MKPVLLSTLAAAAIFPEVKPVTSFDTRLECPDDDTKYTLIVRWETPFEEKREERKVEVDVDDDKDGDGGAVPGAPPTPGSFVVVTPILITSSLVIIPPPTATPVPGQTLPGGVLGTITELPETGVSAANPAIYREESSLSGLTASEKFQVVAGEFPALRLIFLLAGVAGGLFLISRQLNR